MATKANAETRPLKEVRVGAGLGSVKCARLAGLNRPLLYRYEAGIYKPGAANALKIARVLGVELGEVAEFRHLVEETEAAEHGLSGNGSKTE